MMREWHYYSDQFDSRKTGEHGWRKGMFSDSLPPNGRESTHMAGERCRKLCKAGQWSIPGELTTLPPETGTGPFGYWSGPYAVSWWVVLNGRVFKLIRHNGRNSNLVCEMEWRFVNSYAHIRGMENAAPEWKWSCVQSRESY